MQSLVYKTIVYKGVEHNPRERLDTLHQLSIHCQHKRRTEMVSQQTDHGRYT